MPVVARGPNLGEQVFRLVRERIVGGHYPPGRIINESELAAQLAVSRTPVSNALIMLRERGLVEGRQGRLAVPRLDIDDVRDLYHCRLALDGLATRLAAERVTTADLAAWVEDDRGDDDQALWVGDLGFHERIYGVSGNRHLARFARIAADLVAVYRHTTIRRLGEQPPTAEPRSRADVLDEHRCILEALRRRDPEAAEAAARSHIERVIAHLDTLDVVTRENDDTPPPSTAAASP